LQRVACSTKQLNPLGCLATIHSCDQAVNDQLRSYIRSCSVGLCMHFLVAIGPI